MVWTVSGVWVNAEVCNLLSYMWHDWPELLPMIKNQYWCVPNRLPLCANWDCNYQLRSCVNYTSGSNLTLCLRTMRLDHTHSRSKSQCKHLCMKLQHSVSVMSHNFRNRSHIFVQMDSQILGWIPFPQTCYQPQYLPSFQLNCPLKFIIKTITNVNYCIYQLPDATYIWKVNSFIRYYRNRNTGVGDTCIVVYDMLNISIPLTPSI